MLYISALSLLILTGCGGKGADDTKFTYNPDTLISENRSNVYVEPPHAPDGFKVIYSVDAGDGTPETLEANETFGTRNSTEDRAFGKDAVTGFQWGYTSATSQYYADANNSGSIRGDERNTAGKGIEYAFEIKNGSYTVVMGFKDPWANPTRLVDLIGEGKTLKAGYYIPAEAEFQRFDNVTVTDGQLNLAIARTAKNDDPEADPQISWIEIWGVTDEVIAAPAAKVWISGDFQNEAWKLTLAPQMKATGGDWYEINRVHFQAAGGLKFFNQNQFVDRESWGLTASGNSIVLSKDSISIKVPSAGYYDVKFNISSLQYSVVASDLTTLTPRENMYVVGSGFPQYPNMNWSPENGIPLKKNFNGMGEHVFGIEGLAFSDAVELKIISDLSWNGLDIGFVDAATYNQTAANFFGGETITGSGTPNLAYKGAAGQYTLIFDYAAGRATLFKSRMFLVGAGSAGDWDVGKAVEMEQGADGWYELALRFTNQAGNDAIKPYGDFKFVSEQSWNGGNYGLLNRSVSLTDMANSGSSDAIPAPAPGYYTVKFNPQLMQYKITPLELAATRSNMYVVGKGYVDYPNLDWSVENSIPMTANFQGQGDYVFGLECLEFSDSVELKFEGQLSWDGLDVGFVNGGIQTAPLIWVKANAGSGSADLKLKGQAGFYDVTFDYLINRISVIPNKSGVCK